MGREKFDFGMWFESNKHFKIFILAKKKLDEIAVQKKL